MTMRLYRGNACWLLVPDFLQLPVAAARHEPLEFLGYIREEQLRPIELQTVKLSIRERFFAQVPESIVQQLWPSLTPD